MLDRTHILYVEDDPGSRKVMRLLVSRLGSPRLTIFNDSYDFLDRVTALHPQPTLFLLDIHVRPYDGFAMLDMLRAHPNFTSTMAVALTASVMNAEVRQLKAAGFDGVLAKPLKFHEFPATLERISTGERIWTVTR